MFALCQIGILVSLMFSIVATAVLSDLWSKEWKTLLLSFQVIPLLLLLLLLLLLPPPPPLLPPPPSFFRVCSSDLFSYFPQRGSHSWHLFCLITWPGDGALFTFGWSVTDDGAGLADSFAFLSYEQQRWGAHILFKWKLCQCQVKQQWPL